jgi:hypothetical protein
MIPVFLRKKTVEFQKTPSEAEILDQVRSGGVTLPPFQIEVSETARTEKGPQVDAIVLLRWGKRNYRFVAECERHWTPKALAQVADQVRRYARPPELYPLVIVPYLPEPMLRELEDQGVSGIDLCGNGVVAIPDEVLVYRAGKPNRFRWETEIKNVFRGTSSLVPRAFLVRGEYASVQEARREVLERGGHLVLGTVSKVCKALEALLLIERRREKGSAARELRLLQPEKLLDFLASNYVPPATGGTLRGKSRLSPDELRDAFGRAKAKVVRTGFGSVGSYAVMAREAMQYFYTTDLVSARRALGGAFEPTDRFANVTLTETKDETVYFDARPGLVASPVQTYLELVTGDKRSQETAEQLRRVILQPLTSLES